MTHIGNVKNDGNGTPAGIRLSWQAIGVMVSVILLLAGAVGFVRSSDVSMIRQEIAGLRTEFYTFRTDRMHDWDKNDKALTDLQQAIQVNQMLLERILADYERKGPRR